MDSPHLLTPLAPRPDNTTRTTIADSSVIDDLLSEQCSAGALGAPADRLGLDRSGEVGVDEVFERVDEGLALWGGEGLQDLGVDTVHDALTLGGDRGAGVGDRDDAGPAVGRGRLALGVAGLLQGV